MATLVQVNLASLTPDPADNVINTFHFVEDEMSGAQVAEVITALDDFYTAVGTSGDAISEYLSPVLSRVADAVVCKFYNTLVAGEGPYAVETFTLPAADPALGLPSEVGVCLSYKQAGATGLAGRRQRGRIYIGPLNARALAQTEFGRVYVGNDCLETVLAAGLELATTAAAATWGPWVVHSTYGTSIVPGSDPPRKVNPPDLQTDYPIDTLWVDNAFDTQRRRGEDATARLTETL